MSEKHQPDCAWQRVTETECAYKATHHYCPHPKHACTCSGCEVENADKDTSHSTIVIPKDIQLMLAEIRERQRKRAESADLWETGGSPTTADVDTLLSIIDSITQPTSGDRGVVTDEVSAAFARLKLKSELWGYLNSLSITPDNIGDIRRACFVPWESEWNGIVRDETARREFAASQKEGSKQ